ncbi:hypothetical protein [Sediminibacterium ginsengisoli]|uniref:Uncharacterized protein n=1 Tax=Sediminibacterium ginsengisoli TaxID=413434 RepID=A0A1T4Q795_9BACT|nr:hypothetical protein [Sediminibacterium ginsengisoli]SJZ99118.1 hypothetical protein SAMN04488132_107161 [Sediminibacterium ginsengisoli]
MEKEQPVKKADYPRILYIADVPVELSFAGATLIYRLLEEYPKDKLVIIQGMTVNNSKRINGVVYHNRHSTFRERLKQSKFAKFVSPFFFLRQAVVHAADRHIVRTYQPDIILTIPFRLRWVQAYRIAREYNIPLHLILHDDWLITEKQPFFQKQLEKIFIEMYRFSQSRLCISPNMEAYYRMKTGKDGEVLLPSRGVNDKIFSPNITRLAKNDRISFCYAGSVFTSDFLPMLDLIAKHTENEGCDLHIFSDIAENILERYEHLRKNHVCFYSMVDSAVLVRKMHKEMDVSIVLNSFEMEEAFRYNFSSKIVDYTSAALPVFFWGPSTGGIISWAMENGCDNVLQDNDEKKLAEQIRLLKTGANRQMNAEKMLKKRTAFDYEHNHDIFIKSISIHS